MRWTPNLLRCRTSTPQPATGGEFGTDESEGEGREGLLKGMGEKVGWLVAAGASLATVWVAFWGKNRGCF